jgi:type III restriction enzyme
MDGLFLHSSVVLEEFQRRIVTNMMDRVQRFERPLLLRSPTGSGKTLMIGRVLNDTVGYLPTVWFWFVPYSNLVTQTRNSLEDHCPALHPYLLASGRQYDHQPGDVLIANVQQVATSGQQRAVFQQKVENIPTLQEIVARARSASFKIGLVVDEAHIGVSSETEFGKICRRLSPDRLILATATPRDTKLNAFLVASGYGDYEAFAASRDEVVAAGLNKRYVAAFVYRVNEAWQSLADLQRTVLKRAWARHLSIKEKLAQSGIAAVPLLLVQVANGEDKIKEAFEYLVSDCRVRRNVIATYEGSDATSTSLTMLAQDPTKEVLIFKEAAGTGFDAPRAFTLASTKNVSNPAFATQFLGRIMRVDRQVRSYMQMHPHSLDPDLDTGYIYLANGDVQVGFQQAVNQIQQVRSEMEGALEKLHMRAMADGSAIITNRLVNQGEMTLRWTEPESIEKLLLAADGSAHEAIVATASPAPAPRAYPEATGLFGTSIAEDTKRYKPTAPRKHFLQRTFADVDDLRSTLATHDLQFFPLRESLQGFPCWFKTERRPSISSMTEIVGTVVRRLDLSFDLITRVVGDAMGGLEAREIRTDLVKNISTEERARAEIDRTRLAAQTVAFLSSLPQVEIADVKSFQQTLVNRLTPEVKRVLENMALEHIEGSRVERVRRDTAFLLVRAKQAEIAEKFNEELSNHVVVIDAEPVPGAFVFPSALNPVLSARNIYGVLPPTKQQIDKLDRFMTIDEREAVKKERLVKLSAGTSVTIAGFDNGFAMNSEELDFARALDEAPFVLWWTRNPDRKPYSSSVVRADSGNNFYPDFIVCVRFWDADPPSVRLLETKDNTKDAANKARRQSKPYGRVIFLTRNNNRLFIVEPDGTLGREVDIDLHALKDALMKSHGSAAVTIGQYHRPASGHD